MKFHLQKADHNGLYRWISVAAGVLINILFSYIPYKTGIPLYLDTVGTLFVTVLSGVFPGVLTAVLSNAVCSMFNDNSLYFSFISVLIALITSRYVRNKRFKRKRSYADFWLCISVVSGLLGITFQWLLLKGPQFEAVSEVAGLIFARSGTGYFLGAALVNIGLNLVDKLLCAAVALLLLILIPRERRDAIRNSSWRQKPLTPDEIRKANKNRAGNSLITKMSLLIGLLALTLAGFMAWIGIRVYSENVKTEYTTNALHAAEFAASVIDGDRIEEYIALGREAEGYEETEDMLYRIRKTLPGVQFLYVLKIEKNGCIFVFDLDTEEFEAAIPGEFIEIEEGFKQYMPQLLAGEEIDPIETDDSFGWLLTAYYPVKNSNGKTVCYAGADVSMQYLSDYAKDFLIKAMLLFSGVFVLVLVLGLTLSGYYLFYPISSITDCVKGFVKSGGEQKALDENVKKIRAVDIHTDDEIEELYSSVSRMEADMAEHVRDIRHYMDATAKMQNGLIVTMADMVENRDSDTGAHIQKTAAYVRIILEGLKKKGYYLEKLTPKYMADCEMSAPLHDIGKINISDAVLNKPGKLTDEEYEIMKTHTTAGRKILENAIATVEGENYLKEARNMAGYHHERWDGKGYPEGLHGAVIPLSARIMAVADVFDALTSPRVYKPAFPLEKALAILTEGAGAQFDPKVVEVFMDSLPEVKRVLKKYNQEIS